MKTNHQVRVCVPVCESGIDALKQACARASKIGDLIELRLDCLAPPEFDRRSELRELIHKAGSSAILTFRPAEQGGHRPLVYASRYVFWCAQQDATPSYLMDVELDVAEGFTSSKSQPPLHIDWKRIICSHHDFVGVPADLEQIYDRMAHTPARILKIAVQADDLTDCIPVFRLLDQARLENRELVAIAMGTAGIATRILGPSRGSFLTYGALEQDSATAPGQIRAEELRTLYRIYTLNRQTQITGLVGLPVSHSVSPQIHNAGFETSGFDGVYIPFEVRDIASFIKRMVHPRTRELDWNMRGLSVTAPHKSAVMNHLDWIEPAAKEIGAVNTVVIEDGALNGYNTDAAAFIKTLAERGSGLRDARFAIIGAGGAASAVLWGLRQKKADVTVYARDVKKARSLAERFGAAWKALGPASFADFDVVINATPLGTAGVRETETSATATQLGGARLAYDLVYNPSETRFMREAREAGCDVLGGLEMLVTQAAEQFRLWTGTEAPQAVMREAAERALGHNV